MTLEYKGLQWGLTMTLQSKMTLVLKDPVVSRFNPTNHYHRHPRTQTEITGPHHCQTHDSWNSRHVKHLISLDPTSFNPEGSRSTCQAAILWLSHSQCLQICLLCTSAVCFITVRMNSFCFTWPRYNRLLQCCVPPCDTEQQHFHLIMSNMMMFKSWDQYNTGDDRLLHCGKQL